MLAGLIFSIWLPFSKSYSAFFFSPAPNNAGKRTMEHTGKRSVTHCSTASRWRP